MRAHTFTCTKGYKTNSEIMEDFSNKKKSLSLNVNAFSAPQITVVAIHELLWKS